jgi:hypothetical protein
VRTALDGLRACGYVRTLLPDPAGLEGVAQEVRQFAARTGLSLRHVFRDVGTTGPDEPFLPGFVAALDDLRERDADAVVIPSPGHLSLLPDVRRWMVRLIRENGGLLIVMDAPSSVGLIPGERR